jgi:FkbM family methyltransferase
MMLEKLKPLVEKAPLVSEIYRSVRDQVRAFKVRPEPTPYGFLFGGNAEMSVGAFEPDEIAFAQEALKTAEVFVDIGANLGLYTCLALRQGVAAVAFEPLAENLTGLYANLRANGWTDVEVFPLALSDRSGLVELFGGSTGASLIPSWSGASTRYKRTVPTTTLDLILAGRFPGKRLFLKMDVEGAELRVLRGATAVLAREPRPVWMVEVCLTENQPTGINPDYEAIFDAFWAHGYEARPIGDQRPITRDEVRSWAQNRRRTRGGGNVTFA